MCVVLIACNRTRQICVALIYGLRMLWASPTGAQSNKYTCKHTESASSAPIILVASLPTSLEPDSVVFVVMLFACVEALPPPCLRRRPKLVVVGTLAWVGLPPLRAPQVVEQSPCTVFLGSTDGVGCAERVHAAARRGFVGVGAHSRHPVPPRAPSQWAYRLRGRRT